MRGNPPSFQLSHNLRTGVLMSTTVLPHTKIYDAIEAIKEQARHDALNGRDGRDFKAQREKDLQEFFSNKSTELILEEQNIKAESASSYQRFTSNAEKVYLENTSKIKGAVQQVVIKAQTEKSKRHDAITYIRYFKDKNEIRREPQQPNVFLNSVSLIAIAVVEGMANSVFFLSSGLMPNVIEAAKFSLSLAVANVFISAIGGGYLSVRYLHRSCTKTQRYMAMLGAFFTVMVLISIHYAVAIVRSTGSLDNLLAFYGSPSIIINDINSILILAVGLVASVFACYKGVSAFSDSIPDYGDLKAQVEDFESDVDETHEEQQEVIFDLFDQSTAEINKTLSEMQKHHSSIEQRTIDFNAKAQSSEQRYDSYHSKKAEELEIYISTYKSISLENIAIDSHLEKSAQLPEFDQYESNEVNSFYKEAQQKISEVSNQIQTTVEQSQKQLELVLQAFYKG